MLHIKKDIHQKNVCTVVYCTKTSTEGNKKVTEVLKKFIKIKSSEEQIQEAAIKRTSAKVRRQTLLNSLGKLLPKHIQAQEGTIITIEAYHSLLKELEINFDIKSQLAASVASKVIKDNIKQTLKTSGLKNRQKAEIELLALIEMVKKLNALIRFWKVEPIKIWRVSNVAHNVS